MEQFAPAASDVPQVVVLLKSAASVPAIEMERDVSDPVPLFVTVTDWEAPAIPTVVDAKVSDVADSFTAGAAATPVPESETVCGDPLALSAILNDAVRAPAATGLKVTEMEQFAPAASDVPQVVVLLKSAASVPAIEMERDVSDPVPLFVTETDWEALATPTVVEAKVSEVQRSRTGA